MGSSLEKYLQQIRDATSKPGVYAYRGQSSAEWSLHSAATRRLTENLGDGALIAPEFSKVYIDYHRETLVDAARTRGFGIETGRDISDLQLLAKLQHFGAATGLLDFTWNPLVALWFASRESDSDGRLFVVNANDPIHVAKLPGDPEGQTIAEVFTRADNEPGLLYWEPMWSGDAVPRILRQRGVFVIGRPLLPTDGEIIREIEVSKDDKASLTEELRWLDICESTLFPDVYGFSLLEGAKASAHVPTPHFYLIQGNQFFQAGRYEEAIYAYDRCIGLAPCVGGLYFLRGNAKSAAERYGEAVGDYRQAITHKKQPILGLGRTENYATFSTLVFMAYFNCGNALVELCDYQEALNCYNEAIKMDDQSTLSKGQAFYNRGNVYLDLGQFDKAINDYDTAISFRTDGVISPGLHFNKGNAQVANGQFEQALESYRLAEAGIPRNNGPIQNRESLERMMNTIGTRDYQCDFVQSPDAPIDRLVVQVAGDKVEHVNVIFKGRVGNTGNFGWQMVGGEGFSGRRGFVFELVWDQKDDASTTTPPVS